MILIFDLDGGLCCQIKDLISEITFCKNYNLSFSIRFVTCRPITNASKYDRYSFLNLYNDKMLETYNYVNYNEIKQDITKENSFDFFNTYIKGYLWKFGLYKDYLYSKKQVLVDLLKSDYKYIIVGGAFWHWYNYIDPIPFVYSIIPSNKILNIFNSIKSRLQGCKYNYIHYRYEDDWNHIIIDREHKKYIKPTIDDLIEKLPFKSKLPIYLASSCITSLHNKGYINQPIETYKNILYKYDDEVKNLNFDECGFIDFLFGMECEEIYGFSYSGFSKMLNNIKKTNNFYDKIDIFIK